MEIIPADEVLVLVLCPRLAPVAHAETCSFRHLFLPSRPDGSGDWSGMVTDLDQIRKRFPGVLFHKCLLDAMRHGIGRSTEIPPSVEPSRRQRGEHPYGLP